MATITKVVRKTGHAYKAVIRLRGTKPFSKTFKLRKDAKAWAERVERDIDEARAYGNTRVRAMTLRELVRAYERQYTGNNHSAFSCLKEWVRVMGDMALVDITRQVIREELRELETYEVRCRDEKGKIKTVKKSRAPATLNRYKSALSAVFEFGREELDLHENPCRQVKAMTENNARIRFLSLDERKELLKACKKSEWKQLYLLVMMAITTGARLGELLHLRWDDVSTVDRLAYVHKSKNGEPRVLPLTGEVVTLLLELSCPTDGNTLIFRATHDPYKPFEFRKHWNKALKEAEIKNFRFHDLRHTCASYLAQNGASLLQIADVLGHKQMEVTRRYAHLCVDHKQDLVDRVLGNIK